jgi:hypothetical protein
MKRPVEFWATVALALVIVYMIHDAYGERTHTPREVVHIEEIVIEDAWESSISPLFEPAGIYYEKAQNES